MTSRNRIELSWPGKDQVLKLEPRVLVSQEEMAHGALQDSKIIADGTDNLLIKGDNLLALRALESEFAGRVKCAYADPPYNTGAAFEHYDDGLEHSLWMNMMKPRIEATHRLLRPDGTFWISVDDHESHYLKVMLDEVFGRSNFVATVVWQKKHTRANDARWLSDNHDFILVYAKDKQSWRRNLIPRNKEDAKGYSNPDDDPRGPWTSGPCHVKTPNPKDIYEIVTPSGRKVMPPPGTSWRFNERRFQELIEDNQIYFGKTGANVPRFKRFLSDVPDGLVPTTLWLRDEVGDNQEAKKDVKAFNSKDVFSTPKPERLLERILTISTEPGDLVLDAFAGSGTTGAVAHKMNRRWIMIEMGDHADTHIRPRMVRIVDGHDTNDLSKRHEFTGGGGFRYATLAPSLLKKDKFGNWVVNPEFNAELLAESVCKLEGFTYAPSPDEFWLHGFSSEDDYIFVTTQHLGDAELARLEDELPEEKSLLVCCKAFKCTDVSRFKKLSVKKIPRMVLNKCEWDRDDYSLHIQESNDIGSEKEERPSLEAFQ